MAGSTFYNSIAPLYDLLMKASAFLDGVKPSKWRKVFIRSLGLKTAERVLEVGVGTGINLPLVARQIDPEGLIVGVDNSLPMLEQSREKLLRKKVPVSLSGGSAENLPFKDDSFDTVYIFGSFNLIRDQEKTVKELMRVTPSGGLVVISDKSLAGYRNNSLRKIILQALEPDLMAPPPLDSIPLPQSEIEQSWLWNNLFYVLRFRNPKPSKNKERLQEKEPVRTNVAEASPAQR